jgi:hypothetical protein
VKRTRREEPYIYAWKQHKESPCVTIFISNYQKGHVSLFLFYVFSSTKSENRKLDRLFPGRGGNGGMEEVAGKKVGG